MDETPNAVVQDTYAEGTDLVRIITKIEEALEGETRSDSLTAMIALVLLTQNPKLESDALSVLVYETSKYVCTLLAGTEVTEAGIKRMMN